MRKTLFIIMFFVVTVSLILTIFFNGNTVRPGSKELVLRYEQTLESTIQAVNQLQYSLEEDSSIQRQSLVIQWSNCQKLIAKLSLSADYFEIYLNHTGYSQPPQSQQTQQYSLNDISRHLESYSTVLEPYIELYTADALLESEDLTQIIETLTLIQEDLVVIQKAHIFEPEKMNYKNIMDCWTSDIESLNYKPSI